MDKRRSVIVSLEEKEKAEAWLNRPMYSAPVKIANWSENLFLQEEQLKIASYKRTHCLMLVQQTRKMLAKLLTPVDLADESPFITYGLVYQLKACDVPNRVLPGGTAMGLYLSGLVTENNIETSNHFVHGCALTASPEKSPCVRNTFKFVGCDGQSDGEAIYYGVDFYIRIYESGSDGYLFVQCENPTIDDFGSHLKPRLSQSPDFYSRFKFLHWDPKLREETKGSGAAPNSRMIIRHTASGQNLSAEYSTWIPTLFGAECVVSCHTFKNSHKMETAENMWKIVTNVRPDLNLYCRSAKGEQIPEDLLN